MKKIKILIIMLLIFSSQCNLLAMNQRLMSAVWGKDIEEIGRLIEQGADVNFVNQHGHSVLMTAVLGRNSSPEIIQLLIDRGAIVDFVNRRIGYSILMMAVLKENISPEIIQLLIDRGARVDFVDRYGNSVLMTAVLGRNSSPEIIQLLIDRGADVNAVDRYGNSVLTSAVLKRNPRPEIIQLLIDRGADVDFMNRIGRTVTYYAREKGIIAPNETLAEWYRTNLYNTRDETGDFTIIVEGTEVPVHKVILSERSKLFKNMFEMATNNGDDIVNYPGDLSLPALNAIIEFMYTRQILNLTQEIALELLGKFAGESFMLSEGELEQYLELFLKEEEGNNI